MGDPKSTDFIMVMIASRPSCSTASEMMQTSLGAKGQGTRNLIHGARFRETRPNWFQNRMSASQDVGNVEAGLDALQVLGFQDFEGGDR